MNISSTLRMTLLGGLLFVAFSSITSADAGDRKTYVTFRKPVEVPGAVLPPGKYVMKLLDSSSNRHVVQIAGEDEKRVYSTFLAVPHYNSRPADQTVLTFYEMPAGQPQALKSWFYPGDSRGQGFPYPKRRAIEIAQASRQRVAVASVERPRVPLPRPAVAAKPEPGTETAAEPFMEPAPITRAEDLPDTGGGSPNMLFLGLAGTAALAAAAGLRMVAKRLA